MQSRIPPSAGVSAQSPTSGKLAQAMLTARAQVLSNSGVDALRTWAGLAAPIPLQPAANLSMEERSRQALTLYGAALAASRLRDFTGAAAQLVKLSALTKSDDAAARLHRLLAAELALAADDVPQAATHLAVNETVLKTLAVAPDDRAGGQPVKVGRPEVILGASAAIRAGRASEAAERLQTWVAAYPRDAQAWQLLSSAHAALGKSLRAIRADAESQVDCWTTRRLPTALRRRRNWHASLPARARPTTLRPPSSTAARARLLCYFESRRSSADSITMPASE